MSEIYCSCCSNLTHNEEQEAKYFYDLGEITLPVCRNCYNYVRTEIEIFKWELISNLRANAKLAAQCKQEEINV
jgi:NAD-dependent SIR2 family protein deacetylase